MCVVVAFAALLLILFSQDLSLARLPLILPTHVLDALGSLSLFIAYSSAHKPSSRTERRDTTRHDETARQRKETPFNLDPRIKEAPDLLNAVALPVEVLPNPISNSV